jgi:hypothetical protein
MDEQVGILRAAVATAGAADNTVIAFFGVSPALFLRVSTFLILCSPVSTY